MDNLAYLEEDADRKMSSNSLPNGCPEIISLEVMKPRGKSLEKKKYKYDEVYVGTQWAEVLVAIQGDRRKPALMTYHDLGLNLTALTIFCFNVFDRKIRFKNVL
ncbi:hypothetical protein QYM36_014348 [Artemia franciscana]|uniref:Uncharacterized protein n=1 Tax=Artemia franciscana TaxID=6661 RepID=A0AA88HE97_ARTSF|nr:hypothetical protein QYM36_014348 [Artemia franciscana]